MYYFKTKTYVFILFGFATIPLQASQQEPNIMQTAAAASAPQTTPKGILVDKSSWTSPFTSKKTVKINLTPQITNYLTRQEVLAAIKATKEEEAKLYIIRMAEEYSKRATSIKDFYQEKIANNFHPTPENLKYALFWAQLRHARDASELFQKDNQGCRYVGDIDMKSEIALYLKEHSPKFNPHIEQEL